VNIAVFEVGISNFGELSPILNIINPKIALLCNIGNAHSGNLGGIKGVIKEKSVLSRKLAYDAMLVYNSDDQKSVSIAKIFNGKKLTFGYTLNSDMQILNMKTDIIDINAIDKVLKFKSTASIKYKHNIIKIYLNLPGKHNLFNAIAAATVCIACNVDLKMAILGMRKVVSLTGRGNVNCLKNGAFIINDSYNSNPESMISSLKIFTYIINARCIAVIGDMLEIYNPEIQHQNIGIYCAKSNVKLLFVYGRYASDIIIGALKAGFNLENIIHVNNLKKLSEKLNNIIKKNDVILIKGSRKLKMETILENLNDLYVI
jgi:UDP-N-acetylmuramoyl-tripeptide--D-alanyl-D-alanine ligase